MPQLKFVDDDAGDEIDTILNNCQSGMFDITDMSMVGATVLMKGRFTREKAPDLHNFYLPAGAWVPALGRVKLYQQLKLLDERVLYHDTDSIIYIYDPLLYNIPEDDVLGGWSVEDIDAKHGGLVEFVGMGPKSYGLRAHDGTTQVKVKGLSLKLSHAPLLDFTVMRACVQAYLATGECSTIGIPQLLFKYSMGHGISTKHILKRFRFQPGDLKGVLRGSVLYPFGYNFS
jgi:hypothetical protein